ncbi:MAG: VOC family protein [Thermoplasmata archaeon]
MLALADVAIVVSDAKATARWWRKHLGFRTFTIAGGRGHAVLVAPPGERFVLHLCEGFAPVDPGDSGIAFVTDEIEGLTRRMERAGVVLSEPLRKEAWGSMAKFADPDGNIFWLLGVPTGMVKATLRSTAAKATARSRARRPRRATRSAPRRRRR